MTEIQALAAQAALNKMFKDGYLSICTIDNVMKLTGAIPPASTYDTLSILHCVRFNDMPRALLDKLPEMVMECVGAPGLKFNHKRTGDTFALEVCR